jgi:uncharacterized membrane protein YccC
VDARLLRTLYRFGATLAALVIAVVILVFVPPDRLTPPLTAAVLGVALTAALTAEQWLKNSDPAVAAPSVASVTALAPSLTPLVSPTTPAPSDPVLKPAPP